MKKNQRKLKRRRVRNVQKKITRYNKENQEEFDAKKQVRLREKAKKIRKIHEKKYGQVKKKALKIFGKKNLILTGDGLSRTELRILENREFIKSTMVKLQTGQIIKAWGLKHKFAEEVAKITPLEKKTKKEKAKKPGFWARLWASIKKFLGVKNGQNALHKSD